MVNEALLCGIPVITFNNASNSEYIMNGKNGILIEKYETTLFAKSIFDYVSAKYSFSDAIEIRNSVLHIHEKNNWNKIFKKNIYG
jgi:glycosyltransferase involved in cell wall biosynthesis